MTETEFCERVIAMFGKLILDAMDALAEIEHAGVAAPGGDVRVQGGVRIAVEERGLFAMERMQSLPRGSLLLRGHSARSDSKSRRNHALLEGKSGPALRQQTKIGATVRSMQQWLLAVVGVLESLYEQRGPSGVLT